MGLSENARKKRNEKKKKNKRSNKDCACDCGTSDQSNFTCSACATSETSTSCSSSSARRPLIGALTFDEQKALDENQNHLNNGDKIKQLHKNEGALRNDDGEQNELLTNQGPLKNGDDDDDDEQFELRKCHGSVKESDESQADVDAWTTILQKYGDASSNNEDPMFYKNLLQPLINKGSIKVGEHTTLICQGKLDESTVFSSEEEGDWEASMMHQLGIPTGFGAKNKLRRGSTNLEINNEMESYEVEDLSLTPYGFTRYSPKFVMKYLKDMGWEEETGLGKNSQGIIYPLQATWTSSTTGLGFLQKGQTSPHAAYGVCAETGRESTHGGQDTADTNEKEDAGAGDLCSKSTDGRDQV